MTRSRRTRSVGPTPARRRSPAPILIILAVIVAAIFCWVFGRGCGGNQEAKENDALRTYTTSVNKLIERSATASKQFQEVLGSAKDMAKADAQQKLDQIINECKSIAEESKKVSVPSKAAKLQPLLQTVFDLRLSGVNGYKAALMDAYDKKDPEATAAAMSKALTEIVTGDKVFPQYRSKLDEKMKAAKSGDLEYVQVADCPAYVSNEGQALTGAVTEYIADISGEPTSGDEIHGLSVGDISYNPASEDTTESGVLVLPYADSFSVSVAVVNQGNQVEENIPVVVTLTREDSGSPQQQTKKITRIKPEETATVNFTGLKPATGLETVNTLKIEVTPVRHEKNAENNVKTLKFVMRPQG